MIPRVRTDSRKLSPSAINCDSPGSGLHPATDVRPWGSLYNRRRLSGGGESDARGGAWMWSRGVEYHIGAVKPVP